MSLAELNGSADGIRSALLASQGRDEPYRHWLLEDVLPDALCEDVLALPFDAPAVGDTDGRRDTHNATRRFFGRDEQRDYPVCRALADAFQNPRVIETIERLCGLSLGGSYLRIEYCQDREGFWLEPHTDIGAKLFTMLIYLSDGPGSEAWGTDIYRDSETWVGRAPYAPNRGLIFVPAENTWHGFEPRPVAGVRQSLIVNYVKDEWRARDELAFPDSPIAGSA